VQTVFQKIRDSGSFDIVAAMMLTERLRQGVTSRGAS